MNQDEVAASIITALGEPVPNPNTVEALKTWFAAEGGAGPQWGIAGNIASFNPLNTTLRVPGSIDTPGNGAFPVQAYPDWPTGIAATVATLKQTNMAGIVQELLDDGRCAELAAAVGASPWGTGDFSALCGDAPAPSPEPAPAPPIPVPEPQPEEDMPLYVTNSKQTGFVVAADLSSKRGIIDGPDAAALLATGLYKQVDMSDAMLELIPGN